MYFKRSELEKNNFKGFVKIDELKKDLNVVPKLRGVYIVFRNNLDPPVFLNKNTCGWFKGKNPTVSLDILESKWINDAHVLYIGQTSRPLYVRIGEYMKIGCGKP